MNHKIKIFSLSVLVFVSLLYISNTIVGAALGVNVYKSDTARTEYNSEQADRGEVSKPIYEEVTELPVVQQVESQSTCGGNWFKVSNYQSSINLDVSPLANWNGNSNPTVVQETKDNRNVVVIGHNRCKYGDCLRPYGQFAEIINTKTDDSGELCLNGEYFAGKVIFSQAVSQYDVHIMDDWMGKDIVTVFTCYGECLDQNCTSTDKRYAIVFERNKV